MEVNSIHDLIVWTQRYHEQLEKFYEASADHADEERIQLLLDYFKSHQRRLADTYERILTARIKKSSTVGVRNIQRNSQILPISWINQICVACQSNRLSTKLSMPINY